MFWYLFDHQSNLKIEESSLESMSKDVRTGRPDTPSKGGGTWAVAGCRNDVARLVHFNQWSGQHIQNFAPQTFHSDVSHPKFCSVNIPPGCLTFEILLRRHSIRIFCIRRLPPDGKGGRFNFPGQTYPDSLIALTRRVSQPFCTVPWCSPEASRYVRPTFWDILL